MQNGGLVASCIYPPQVFLLIIHFAEKSTLACEKIYVEVSYLVKLWSPLLLSNFPEGLKHKNQTAEQWSQRGNPKNWLQTLFSNQLITPSKTNKTVKRNRIFMNWLDFCSFANTASSAQVPQTPARGGWSSMQHERRCILTSLSHRRSMRHQNSHKKETCTCYCQKLGKSELHH